MKRWMVLLFVSLLATLFSSREAQACSPIEEGWHVNIPMTPIVLPANGVLALDAFVYDTSYEDIDPNFLTLVVTAPDGAVVEGAVSARMLTPCLNQIPPGCSEHVLLMWRATGTLAANAEYQFVIHLPLSTYGDLSGTFTTTEAVTASPEVPVLADGRVSAVAHELEWANCMTNDCNTCYEFTPPCSESYASVEDWVPQVEGMLMAGPSALPVDQVLLYVAGADSASWGYWGTLFKKDFSATTPSPWCMTVIAESLIDGSTTEGAPFCLSDPRLTFGPREASRPFWCLSDAETSDASEGDEDVIAEPEELSAGPREESGMCGVVVRNQSPTLPLVLLWGVMFLGIVVGLGRRRRRLL